MPTSRSLPPQLQAPRSTPVTRLLTMLLLALALATIPVTAMKQQWTFADEDREQFHIERFGFGAAGHLDVRVRDVAFQVDNKAVPASDVRAGLLFVHEDSLWEELAQLQDPQTDDSSSTERFCALQNHSSAAAYIDLTDATTWTIDRSIHAAPTDTSPPLLPGFYYVFYAQCTHGLSASFHMDAVFQNGAFNYLSAGDAPLPTVYLLMSAAFSAAALLWLRFLQRHAAHVHRIHTLMAVLVVFKAASLFAEAMQHFYMKTHGDLLTTWTVVYYIFAFVKSVTLVGALLLLGAGYSLLTPHLQPATKLVVSLVVVLQISMNVAMIVLEQTSIGTQAWRTWRDVLHLLDVACCVGVLWPIVASIRLLRAAALTDGKAHINLTKLTHFRSFYVVVVTYLYATRIALLLLEASLPFDATWVAPALYEGATGVLFSVIGYRFRPIAQHPYLAVETHIASLDEFSLDAADEDDDDVNDYEAQLLQHQRVSLQRRELKVVAATAGTDGVSTRTYRSDL